MALSFTVYGQSALEEIRFNVAEYQIIGDNPLGQEAYKVLTPFVGEHLGLEGLSSAADALEQALVSAGYSFHRVNLPPQELFSGSVTLEIVQFKIGRVKVSGNTHFDAQNIKRSVPALKEGQAPNTFDVSQAVKFANSHQSKDIVLRFNEGEEPNTVDAELKVSEKDPSTVFFSLDNSGGKNTEAIRLTLGYQQTNLFNKDHSLTATLTVAPEDIESATQVGLSYQIPFYSTASYLNFLLSSSESNTGTVADSSLVTGKGNVFGVTYTKAIFSSRSIDQNISIGLIYKLFDNQQVNATSKVLSFPLELSYDFKYRTAQSLLAGGITLATNTESGEENTDAAYVNSGRSNATSAWSAVRYRLSMDYLFNKDWLMHMNLSGQTSNDRLIYGEQFGVGGSATLRGFEERSIIGDEGYVLRVELWMPTINSYQIRWLLFADQANVKLKESSVLAKDGLDTDLSSIGLGLRWSWRQQLSLNVDVGQVTKEGGFDTTINRKDDTKAHVGLVYRF